MRNKVATLFPERLGDGQRRQQHGADAIFEEMIFNLFLELFEYQRNALSRLLQLG